MRILITGIAGILGLELAKKLSKHEIFGIDVKKIPDSLPMYVTYVEKSILDPEMNQIFFQFRPEIIIHLAWIVEPVHTKKLLKAYDIDYNGTMRIMELSLAYSVKQFIFMSSALAYGAFKDNPIFLTEEDNLKAKQSFHYSYHKQLVEREIVQPFMLAHPEMIVTVLRPPGFLGPMVNNYIARILKSKILPVMIGGRNTRIQFLHINDLLDVIELVIQKSAKGTFNVSPDDVILMKNIPKLLSGHKLYITEFLARNMVTCAWLLHLYPAPSSYLDFVRHEFVVSNEKIKRELEWKPKYTTSEAIKSIIVQQEIRN